MAVAQLEQALPLSSSPPPASLARQAEVVVVSGYQPPSHPPNQRVEVHLDRPGHKVLLVLASYETVIWHVSASARTDIAGIVVSGYHTPIVVTDVSTHGYRMKLPYTYKVKNRRFVDLLRRLHATFGIDRIDAFRGRYELPSHIRIARVDSNNPELSLAWPQPVDPKVDFQFPLPAIAGHTVLWSLTGPVDKHASVRLSRAHMAHAPDGTLYTLDKNILAVRRPDAGQPGSFALPATFPRISWPEGVAYDSKRDLVSVVTLGGKGYLYRFDAKAGKWLDYRSLDNVDIHAICYDPMTDRYVAWTSNARLLFISGEGQILFSRKIADDMRGFYRIYDSGNGPEPHLKLAAHGNKVALIYARDGQVRRIWYYNDKTRRTLLTYKVP